MSIPLFESTATLAQLLEENVFTIGRLRASPFVAHLAAEFETFQRSVANLLGCDEDLDRLIDAIDRAAFAAAGGDRSQPVYQQLFGARTRRELERPVLSGKLEAIRGWLAVLEASEHASLSSLRDELDRCLTLADSAVLKMVGEEGTIRDFRSPGQREALIDRYNALRDETVIKLRDFREQNPDEELPESFVTDFFRRSPRRGPEPGMPPREVVLAKMEAIQEELAELNEQLAAIDAQDRAEAALIQAKLVAEEAKAKVAAIEARRGLRR